MRYQTKRAMVLLSVLGVMSAGCQTDTQTGALVGTGVGALAGAVIGNNSGGHGGTGALIGAGAGALVGGGIGAASDANKRHEREEAAYNDGYHRGRHDQGRPHGYPSCPDQNCHHSHR